MVTTESKKQDDKSAQLPVPNGEAGGQSGVNFQPQQFKFYQLQKPLGEGGFGHVFEAWDSKLMRSVAIKRVKDLGSTQATQSLLMEARMAASLQHPAFVKIHAIEDDIAEPAIVMELVNGVTLKQWIKDRVDRDLVTQLPQILDIVAQVAQAMESAHSSKLIHGDLKPSNLMVEPSGQVRILDFGLAVKADLQATTSVSQTDPQGTIAYMAPETLSGLKPSVRSDIYALGVILYEMLHGARPFAKMNGLALAAALIQSSSDDWNYAAEIPVRVIQLIRGMTSKAVAQRYQSMQQVITEIESLQHSLSDTDNKSESVRVPLLSAKKPQPNKVHKNWAIGIGVSALLVFGVWQAAPYLSNLRLEDITPYSESVTMRQGLEALNNADRPGNLDLAQQHFEKILKHNPDNAAAVAGLAITYMHRYVSDKQDETWFNLAKAAAQRAMTLNDQVVLSLVAKALVLANQNQREEALIVYDQALKLEPTNAFALSGKIRVLTGLNRLDEAIRFAQEAHQKFPKDRIILDNIGSIYYQKGDFQNAELSFRKSLEVQPDTIFAYANLSMVLTRLERKDEALQVLQQGLQVRPSAHLYTALGIALFQRGDYEGAASAFENAVSPTKGNPARYNYWGNLADTLLWIPGRKAEAKDAYQKALRLLEPLVERSPNDFSLVSRMGLYLARTGQVKRAPEFIQKALSLAPSNSEVHYRAALAYELMGDRAQALALIGKSVQLGYPIKNIDAEPDLVNLRRDPAYLK